MNIKSIAIFGSTGSIGKNTIELVRDNPTLFKINILTAYSNVELLAQQALEFNPDYVSIADKNKISILKSMLNGKNIKILEDPISEIAKIKVDMVVMAIMGSAAILPTINAITTGNNIALANKECLVCAGRLIMDLAKKHQVNIIPVDSEHSGLFQVFDHKRPYLVKDITLTASGGPFREYSYEQMKAVTKAQALKHPNWTMGNKITIDSASLVNKCLEVIEAYYLFPLKKEQVKIIVHPESIIHAIVNYQDGSMLAQLSDHDMQIPISYALSYPQRASLKKFNQFDLTKIGKLSFYPTEPNKFKSLQLLDSVLDSIESNSPLIFNIANEIAVEAFLKDKINFIQITQVIEAMLERIEIKKLNTLEDILDQTDLVARFSLSYIEEQII